MKRRKKIEFAIIVTIAVVICTILAIISTLTERHNKKKIFLISPVRNVPPEVMAKIEKYVEKLEKEGYKVFWPKRDNPYQKTDTIGIDICDTNFKKILEYPEIHIWLLKDSIGSHFDAGGVYMLARILKHKKKFVFANKDEFADMIREPEKSFPRVLNFLERTTK